MANHDQLRPTPRTTGLRSSFSAIRPRMHPTRSWPRACGRRATERRGARSNCARHGTTGYRRSRAANSDGSSTHHHEKKQTEFSGPRHGNLGLWYTPDTETWFEVTDLGPLTNDIYADNIYTGGEVGVLDAAMVVRDTDILVYINIAKVFGFLISDPHTEIWRLDLSRGEPVEAFDFSTQSLCDWFSPEDIDTIVKSTYEEVGVPLDPRDEMEQREGQNSDCYWADPIVTLSERHEPVDWAGTTHAQHPALDDSVLVSIHEPGFYGMMTGLDALLRVDGHPEPLWFGHTTPESVSGDVETINTLGLTIANKMLKEMGWIE